MFQLMSVSMAMTFTVFVAFASVVLQAYFESQNLSTLTTIVTGLVSLEYDKTANERLARAPRVAIGYGSCSDLYVSADSFLNYSLVDEGKDSDFVRDEITSENELLRSFGYYFRNGAAAERYTSNESLFRKLLDATASGSRRWALGGNAPVMGRRFFQEGADVLIATKMTEKLRDSLPENIRITGSASNHDDIHLIFEYKTNDQWGPFTAPRANRYILHNDLNNPMLSSLESFDAPLDAFDPRLLVISGLQMMDSFPFGAGERESRLSKVHEQMASRSQDTLIHFEMASYIELALVKLLLHHVIPMADSIGMNEQELENLDYFLQHNRISYATESNPRVAVTLDKMRSVFKQLRQRDTRNAAVDPRSRSVTRLHVHTLAFQAILVERHSAWRNTKNAAAKAALTAYRTVCGANIVNPESATLLLDAGFATTAIPSTNTDIRRITFNFLDPVSCWDESIDVDGKPVAVFLCVAPVLVCKEAKQTAGAGDNISASGLILQI